MSATTAAGAGVASSAAAEVRLRYRPVGDVLTVSVRAPEAAGPVQRTEDGDVLVEAVVLPDHSLRLGALQLLDARSHRDDHRPLLPLPSALVPAALDLIQPGHRHHGHPAAHRPVPPTGVREATVHVPVTELSLTAPPDPVGPPRR